MHFCSWLADFSSDFECLILKTSNITIKSPKEIPHQIRIHWKIWTLAN